ncbi:unnamed protein product [Phytomonas sp. EM1]|nr:unnamed protein product [Phytomonas sp. EM1]|eukprot:CCW63171.1 unnamed protein product [Phytomonas sp. isolate EM1]
MRPVRLASLVARCCTPIYNTRDEVQRTVAALVELSSYCSISAEVSELYTPLRRILSRDPNLAAPLLLEQQNDAERGDSFFALENGGKSLAFLLRALPSRVIGDVGQEPSLVQSLAQHTIRGLEQNLWPVQDVKSLLLDFQKKGGYDHSLISAVEAYASLKLASATASDFVDILSIAFTFPELRSKGSLLRKASVRALDLVNKISADEVGRVGAIFNRCHHRHDALASLFHEQSNRVIEESTDGSASLQLFGFLCRHEVSREFADTLQCFLERILGDALFDVESFVLLCESLARIPSRIRAKEMAQAMEDTLDYLGDAVAQLLARPRAEGGLQDEESVETIEQIFPGVSPFDSPDGGRRRGGGNPPTTPTRGGPARLHHVPRRTS